MHLNRVHQPAHQPAQRNQVTVPVVQVQKPRGRVASDSTVIIANTPHAATQPRPLDGTRHGVREIAGTDFKLNS